MENATNIKNYAITIENLNRMNLIHKIVYSEGTYYRSYNYDKNILCYNDVKMRIHRLTILSYPENELLTFTIPKSLTYNTFTEKYPTIDDDIAICEYVEGVLINLFYDNRICKWKVSVDRDSKIDDINNDSILNIIKDVFNVEEHDDINDIALFEYLPKDHSYTFVLKVPSKNLYVTCSRPEIYLIAVYRLDGLNAMYISPREYENWDIIREANNVIRLPSYYNNIEEYSQLSNKSIPDMIEDRIAGIMIKNMNTGEQCKVAMNAYIKHRELMSIDPLSRYKYLCVRRVNKITEYVSVFPNMKTDFFKMNTLYNHLINRLHSAYIHKYIHKQGGINDQTYITIIHHIHHELYMPTVKRNHSIAINRNTIKSYLDSFEPEKVFRILHTVDL